MQEVASRAEPRPPAQHLLARHAEDVLWLARYVERIENLARILDVTHTFSRDGGERDGHNWLAILRINDDQQRFFERHAEANLRSVGHFYLLDRGNPTSIQAAIEAARENARTLRALISTEMWLQINVFHGRIRVLNETDLAPENLSRICAMLKEGCQAHAGITEGTFYRDQSWRFYALGRHLERADQTTRLVDVGYHTLRAATDSGSDIDSAQWITLLRAAAGYHAYHRTHPAGFSILDVIAFLLLDRACPRSVSLNLEQVGRHLERLASRHFLPVSAALERLQGMRAMLDERSVEEGVRQGLSLVLDRMQAQIGALYGDVAQAVFAA
jgi:uncharacterized alpha-E superfamily protein